MDHHILMQKERKLSPETFFTQLLQTFLERREKNIKAGGRFNPKKIQFFLS